MSLLSKELFESVCPDCMERIMVVDYGINAYSGGLVTKTAFECKCGYAESLVPYDAYPNFLDGADYRLARDLSILRSAWYDTE